MIGILGIALLAATLQTSPCENLQSLSIPRTSITSARLVPEGPFAVPGGRGFGGPGPQSKEPIPAHCRVTMVLQPTSDSNINV